MGAQFAHDGCGRPTSGLFGGVATCGAIRKHRGCVRPRISGAESLTGLIAMDEKWKDILSSLPPKPPRSGLEPYCELIEELRRRGRTYREIAAVLMEKCQMRASRSNIHHFVRVRAQRAQSASRGSVSAHAGEQIDQRRTPATDEVRQRIAAMKQRKGVQQPACVGFDFDPREPLRLRTPGLKIESPEEL